MDDAAMRPRWGYWVLVAVLLVFGMVSILTIGAAFLLVAITLILLAPFRRRRRVFLPGLALVIGFIAGYVLVAPWTCASSAEANSATGKTVATSGCNSVTGISYPENASALPGLLAGAALGAVSATVAFAASRRPAD